MYFYIFHSFNIKDLIPLFTLLIMLNFDAPHSIVLHGFAQRWQSDRLSGFLTNIQGIYNEFTVNGGIPCYIHIANAHYWVSLDG